MKYHPYSDRLGIIHSRVAALLMIMVATFAAFSCRAENVGVSREDLPNYRAAFSIENTTGIAVHYQYRWGNKHAWKKMTLASGAVETHSYPLGEDPKKMAPIPYIRFDRLGGDNRVTWQEYKMKFHAIGYAGYGPTPNITEPKRYLFQFAANGRDLDLNAK